MPDPPDTHAAAPGRLAEKRDEVRRAGAWLGRHAVGVWVAVGAGLRAAEYASDRSLWLDESSLVGNVVGRTWATMLEPMSSTQLAPAGFLALEVALARALGPNRLVLRAASFVFGMAALAGFAVLARRVVRPSAAWAAVGLFAVTNDLVYYSAEVKPYAADLAAAVALTLTGLSAVRAGGIGIGAGSPWRVAGLAALGAGAVWVSFPSAFVLAGLGLVLAADALARGGRPRDRGAARLAALAALGLAWGVSFALAHAAAVQLLGTEGRHGMEVFWGTAFPPWPPGSAREALWPVRRGVYLFVNPLDYWNALGPWPSALPALAAAGIGFVSLARRDRRALALLVLPGVVAVGASYARLYPFHGRLVLWIAPALLLLAAEGLGAVLDAAQARPVARGLGLALRTAVLLALGLTAVYRVAEPHSGRYHNLRGDLRPSTLDPERFPF